MTAVINNEPRAKPWFVRKMNTPTKPASSDVARAFFAGEKLTDSVTGTSVGGRPSTIVIPDECGDSLWDDVLAQESDQNRE